MNDQVSLQELETVTVRPWVRSDDDDDGRWRDEDELTLLTWSDVTVDTAAASAAAVDVSPLSTCIHQQSTLIVETLSLPDSDTRLALRPVSCTGPMCCIWQLFLRTKSRCEISTESSSMTTLPAFVIF